MHFEDFAVGQETKTPGRTVTEADVVAFSGLSGDYNPIHTNAEFAAATPFKQRIAHGALGLAIVTGLDPRAEIAIAKVVATENDFACADLGLQIMGGAGYLMEHDMQRFFRDARIGPIGGGSNEIQRNIIAQLMGL